MYPTTIFGITRSSILLFEKTMGNKLETTKLTIFLC